MDGNTLNHGAGKTTPPSGFLVARITLDQQHLVLPLVTLCHFFPQCSFWQRFISCIKVHLAKKAESYANITYLIDILDNIENKFIFLCELLITRHPPQTTMQSQTRNLVLRKTIGGHSFLTVVSKKSQSWLKIVSKSFQWSQSRSNSLKVVSKLSQRTDGTNGKDGTDETDGTDGYCYIDPSGIMGNGFMSSGAKSGSGWVECVILLRLLRLQKQRYSNWKWINLF